MPGRRKKNFKKNLRNNVIERYTLGSTEIDPSFPMPSGEEDDEATMDAAALQRDKRLEEQKKYGIGFDDDYDYLQHLKDVADMSMSEMKELVVLDPKSETECEVIRIAAANIAGASKPEMDPDWDPEVIAALDEDFDFDDPDNELEDDFMDLANPSERVKPVKCEEKLAENFHDAVNIGFKNSDVLHAEENDNDNEDNSDADSTAMELGDDDDDWTDEDDDEEDNRKASCSEFSSSALPRNKKLQLLDAQTKAVLQREYTEDQIGALDFEELNGRVTFDSDLFKQTVKEIHDAKSVVTLKDIVDSPDRVRPVIPESWKYVEERGENDDGDYDDEDEERRKRHERAMSPKKPQWDCMSILSTLSNTKNIPKTVVWPSPESEKKRKKTSSESMEVSDDRLNSTRGLTLKELEQQMKIERLADAPSTYRPCGETPEEKKERKQAVKEHKRERRAEKKANKLAFHTEMQRQTKVVQVRETQEKIVSLHVPN